MNNLAFNTQVSTNLALYQPKMPPLQKEYYENPHPAVLVIAAIVVSVIAIFAIIESSK